MIEDAIQPVTPEEAEAVIYGQLARVGVATGTWREGAVVRAVVSVMSVIIAACTERAAELARMYSYSTARGVWLTEKARGDGLTRLAATAATGRVTLWNQGSGSYTVAAGDLVVANPTTGVTYVSTQPFSLPPLLYAYVDVMASEAGAHTTSAASTITQMVTALQGVQCFNPSELVGTDEETDEQLRLRARQAPASMSSAGPADAYTYAAKTLPRGDGTVIGVTRARTISDGGTGGVVVYVATASGEVASADRAYLQDAMVRTVLTQCATVQVLSATPRAIPVSYTAHTLDASTDATEAKRLAEIALRDYLVAAPIGGYRITGGTGEITRAALAAVVQRAILGCFAVEIHAPADDIAIDDNQAPTLGTVTASVTVDRQL